jgi:hypothetical protein
MPRQLIEIAELLKSPLGYRVKNNKHHVKILNHRFISKKTYTPKTSLLEASKPTQTWTARGGPR